MVFTGLSGWIKYHSLRLNDSLSGRSPLLPKRSKVGVFNSNIGSVNPPNPAEFHQVAF
jgi:hypothetical protein